jgi:hypothetical protein
MADLKPSNGAMLYAERIGPRLAIGGTMGTVVSAPGRGPFSEDRTPHRRRHRLHLRNRPDLHGSLPWSAGVVQMG